MLDIGGVPYLVPMAKKSKLYNMKDYPKLTDFGADEDCLIIGAGAAPWTYLLRNAEVNLKILQEHQEIRQIQEIWKNKISKELKRIKKLLTKSLIWICFR